MNKEKVIKACEKAKKEWNTFTADQKAKKIKKHIELMLNDETLDKKTIADLQNELLMIEELDSKMIESRLDMMKDCIIENAINQLVTD